MKSFWMVLLSVVLVAATFHSTADASSSRAGSIAGVCVDRAGAPVARATVELTDSRGNTWTTTTDARGHFGFRMLRPGRYLVEGHKRGVGSDRDAVRVTSGTTTRVRLILH